MIGSIILAFIASFAWGLTAILIKIGMKDQNPLFGLFVRAIVAGPILIIIAILQKFDLRVYFTKELFWITLISSVFVVFGDSLFMYILKRYDVTLVQPIASIYPVITTIIVLLTGLEDVGLLILIGTPLIVIGVAIISSSNGNDDNYETHKIKFQWKALILSLTVATLWGSAIFFVSKILTYENTESFGLTGIRVIQIAFGALLVYLLTNRGREHKQFNRKSLLYIIGSGITGFVIGASALFIAVQQIGAAISVPISSTNPVIVVMLSMIFGFENKDMKKIIGTLISVIGTILIVVS